MFDRTYLADVDGTLCVVSETADYDRPAIVANYFPTTARTYYLSRNFDVPIDTIGTIPVRREFPGHYRATINGGSVAIVLTDGGRTLPVKTEERPAPRPPRIRSKLEWSGGHWHKETAKGWRRIE